MKVLFVDKVIRSYSERGVISVGCSADELLEGVLRSLSRTVRFNGATERAHTVLVHSWLVGVMASDSVPEGMKDTAMLAGMMHDFGESVVGDFVMPMKTGRYRGIYERHYEPLERAFVEFVGAEVLGIADFCGKYASVKEYVGYADRIVGEMELYGDVLEMDGESRGIIGGFFDGLQEEVTVGAFRDMLVRLARKLNGDGC